MMVDFNWANSASVNAPFSYSAANRSSLARMSSVGAAVGRGAAAGTAGAAAACVAAACAAAACCSAARALTALLAAVAVPATTAVRAAVPSRDGRFLLLPNAMPARTPEQEAALAKLETALALVEGWVDELTFEAAANLPSAAALRETIRRRRATGGPAEHAFGALVGLDLRPRRLREAAALWASLKEARGIAGRDAIWKHPDLLPTTEDLDDPAGFAGRRTLLEASDSEVDAALEKLLAGEFDAPDASGTEADSTGDGGPGPDESGADGSGSDGGDSPKA